LAKEKAIKKLKHHQNSIATFLLFIILLTSLLTLFSHLLNVKLILLAPLYMFTPFIATLITCFICKTPLTDLGLSVKFNKWFIIAWLLPIVLVFAVFSASLFLPNVSYSPTMEGLANYGVPSNILTKQTERYSNFGLPPLLFLLFLALTAGPTINTLFAFGEELGWRGFLQKELSHLGFWKSSFLIGLVWGLWHAPLILQGYNYPQHPTVGVVMMILFTILFSPLLSYIRIKARSVFAPAVTHGTLNAAAGIPVAFVIGGSDLIIGIQGAIGFTILGILNIGLIKYAKKL
jgi:membrane protease YdiL (CAAX protease family)